MNATIQSKGKWADKASACDACACVLGGTLADQLLTITKGNTVTVRSESHCRQTRVSYQLVLVIRTQHIHMWLVTPHLTLYFKFTSSSLIYRQNLLEVWPIGCGNPSAIASECLPGFLCTALSHSSCPVNLLLQPGATNCRQSHGF